MPEPEKSIVKIVKKEGEKEKKLKKIVDKRTIENTEV